MSENNLAICVKGFKLFSLFGTVISPLKIYPKAMIQNGKKIKILFSEVPLSS